MLQVANFVPETHPIRQLADTFPWAVLVAAVDRSFAQRFPRPTTRGRPPISTRVLLALELLKHELGCSDEQICSRLRTDVAVMYACGIREVQVDGSQEHFVLQEGLVPHPLLILGYSRFSFVRASSILNCQSTPRCLALVLSAQIPISDWSKGSSPMRRSVRH